MSNIEKKRRNIVPSASRSTPNLHSAVTGAVTSQCQGPLATNIATSQTLPRHSPISHDKHGNDTNVKHVVTRVDIEQIGGHFNWQGGGGVTNLHLHACVKGKLGNHL